MKLSRHILLIINFFMVLLVGHGCSDNSTDKEFAKIERFEIEINNYPTLSNVDKDSFKKKYADLISIIYNGTHNDSILSSIPQSPIYKAFSNDVKSKFSTLDTLSIALGEINHKMNSIFKDFKSPTVKTYITQYNQSIVTTDSTVLIGLNQYLGTEHPMYNYYEPYQRLKKVPTQISVDYAEAIIRANIENLPNSKNTLLDRMIYEGMVVYLISETLPDDYKMYLLGYSQSQLEWCMQNETNIWKKLLSQNILYSTSRIVATQMLLPSPFTALISQDTPGEIGRWIGFRIIAKYVKNNNIEKLEQLSSTIINTESQTILMKSKYDGQ